MLNASIKFLILSIFLAFFMPSVCSAAKVVSAETLRQQAQTQWKAGEYKRALALLNRATKRFPWDMDSLYLRGKWLGELGRYDAAIEDFRRISKLVPYRSDAWGQQGWYLILQGRFAEAQQASHQAVEREPWNMTWTMNLGHTYLLQGDGEVARQWYEKALLLISEEAEAEPNPLAAFDQFIKRGWAEEASRKERNWMKKALVGHRARIRYHRNNNNKIMEDALARVQLAMEIGKARAKGEPTDLITDQLITDQLNKMSFGETITPLVRIPEYRMAHLRQAMSPSLFGAHPAKGYEHSLKWIESRDSNVPPSERAYFLKDRFRHYDAYIKYLFQQQRNHPDHGLDRKALSIFERKQGIMFLEQMGQSITKSFAGIPAEVMKKEAELAQQTDEAKELFRTEFNKPHFERNHERLASLRQQVNTLAPQQKNLKTKIRENYPDYYALRYPQPVSILELQQATLAPNETLLIYNVMDEQSLLWLIAPDTFQMFTLPSGEKDLLEQINILRQAMRAEPFLIRGKQSKFRRPEHSGHSPTQSPHDLAVTSHDLYNRLFPAEVRKLIAASPNRTLYIVPTGPLYGLPFGALVTSQPNAKQVRYLIEDHPIAYLSSASLLKTLRQARGRRSTHKRYPLLAFADPIYNTPETKGSHRTQLRRTAYRTLLGGNFQELPETAEEAREIAQILQAPPNSNPLQLRHRASRSNVLALNKAQRLDDYQYLLFATHGVLPEETTEISQPALVLTHPEANGSDGFLTMADVFGLQLNADLVSLTACNSGLGKQVRGEGVIGLTRAFMYAGTPAVGVTLWSVESLSAKQLSIEWFRHLAKTEGVALALQQAKLALLKGDEARYHHPRYWAPLVVFGDGQ